MSVDCSRILFSYVLIKIFSQKCDDDSETSNWIAANTKECPKCNVTIEKDGGCNHMVCKNQNCKTDFCWVCLGPWEPHGSSWYNCNRFVALINIKPYIFLMIFKENLICIKIFSAKQLNHYLFQLELLFICVVYLEKLIIIFIILFN